MQAAAAITRIPVSAIGRGPLRSALSATTALPTASPTASPSAPPTAPPAAARTHGGSALHRFDTAAGAHLLVVDGSRVYDLPPAEAAAADRALAAGPAAEQALLARLNLAAARPAVVDDDIGTPPVTALALNIAEHCNLGCGYCYADGGSFGQAPRREAMGWAVAQAAVDRLVGGLAPGATARLAFMGGEPLLARALLRRATEYAGEACARRGLRLQLALTTNATRLTDDDAAFFAHHGFAVTVSLDGSAALNDRLRPRRGGGGSHAQVLARLPALLARQGEAALPGRPRLRASARITVTPLHRALRGDVEHLIGLGFAAVGVAPSLVAADAALRIADGGFAELLAQIVDVADACERQLLRDGKPDAYPFANLLDALRELHRGTHRPLPCGAGAGYLGVAADGALHACHRFIGDDAARFGDLGRGIDDQARGAWLAQRHVHRQQPCASCWARYLCGGGCHHEVLHRGRAACDFIRGWLDHCLRSYARLSDARPELFG
ncbi:MAG: SPASM domain-containing protein [Proteobacteria bacterium]|nr:SPASM domain-containing protein [Pseudomonadota bacterium]